MNWRKALAQDELEVDTIDNAATSATKDAYFELIEDDSILETWS